MVHYGGRVESGEGEAEFVSRVDKVYLFAVPLTVNIVLQSSTRPTFYLQKAPD